MEFDQSKIQVLVHEGRSLSYWFESREEIDLEPKIQRKGIAWSVAEQAFLIDSVINGYSMPQVFLLDLNSGFRSLSSGSFQYAVIDGRQRLTALFLFLSNGLALNKEIRFIEDESIRLGGLRYSDLRAEYPKIARRIEQYNLPVTAVRTNSEARVRELFLRLNSGKPLTGAELRHSYGTLITSTISAIAAHPFISEFAKVSKSRMQDHNLAAKLLILQLFGPTDTDKRSLDRFALNEYAQTPEAIEDAQILVEFTLNEFCSGFEQGETSIQSVGIIPIWFLLFQELRAEYGSHVTPRYFADFLKNFTEIRKSLEVKSFGQTGPHRDEVSNHIIKELARFNVMNRSGDNKHSIAERVKIARALFAIHWLAEDLSF